MNLRRSYNEPAFSGSMYVRTCTVLPDFCSERSNFSASTMLALSRLVTSTWNVKLHTVMLVIHEG